jgi:hypothetical protein
LSKGFDCLNRVKLVKVLENILTFFNEMKLIGFFFFNEAKLQIKKEKIADFNVLLLLLSLSKSIDKKNNEKNNESFSALL